MKRVIVFSSILIATLIFIQSCKHDPLDFLVDLPDDPIIDTSGVDTNLIVSDCDEDTVYFENDIYPILISNCTDGECHNAEFHKDGINVSTYEDLMESDILKPDDPWDSDLIKAVTESDPDEIMPRPPAAPLTADQIAMLVKWQQQGALNNGCTDCSDATPTFSGTIQPILNSFCISCHDASSPSDGIDLTAYIGSGTNAGVADVAADGRLVGSIMFLDPYTPMPYGGSMILDCYIDQISAWVDAGYPND